MEEGQQPQPPATTWAFNKDDSVSAAEPVPQPQVPTATEVSWTASEYVAHQKNLSWFVVLGFGSVAAAAAVWFVTGDKVSTVMIVIVAVMFGIFAARQPKVLTYQVNHSGIRIGEKFYSFADFKSFSIIDEEQISSIMLMPLKRFRPGISMYYPPEEEDKIVEVVANYLPHEERAPDSMDRLMRKVRF